MVLLEMLVKYESNCIDLDKNLNIVGFSTHLSSFFNNYREIKTLSDFVHFLYDNESFQNRPFVKELIDEVHQVFETKRPKMGPRLVTNNLESTVSYQFLYGVDYIVAKNDHAQFWLTSFVIHNDKTNVYKEILHSYPKTFSRLQRYADVGRFVLDFKQNRNNVYADSRFADILAIPKALDNFYLISRNPSKFEDKCVLTRDIHFFNRIEHLLDGTIKELQDEWYYQERWLKVELKVLKYAPSEEVEYLGGIIYDITEERKLKETAYINQIYELAINTGNIGIFFYDLDKNDNSHFDANDTYADLIGLEKQENGLFLLKDFESSLLSIEEEIQEMVDIKTHLSKILRGEISGSDNQILKIRHLKTKEILYFLSSSKIEERYEDGSPRKLGGIIMDITERIQMQKRQVLFAYNDELTGLPNKRKLMKDLGKLPNQGVGVFFDLDDFKKINDTYGHTMGDEILVAFAESLTKSIKLYKNAEAYRLYGDEFFVFIPDNNKDTIMPFIHDFKSNIARIRCKFKIKHEVSTSFGLTNYTKAMDLDDFIKQSDYAMYQNKINKKQLRKSKR